MKDLHNNIKVSTVLAPVVIDADDTTAGEVIDRQGFESLEFCVSAGTLADGVFTAALAEADAVDEMGDLVDETEVAAADLLGELPVLDEGDSGSGATRKVGYVGGKRYVRLDIVSTDTTDGGPISAVAVQSSARNAPVT